MKQFSEYLRDLVERIGPDVSPACGLERDDPARLIQVAVALDSIEPRPATFEDILDEAHVAAKIAIAALGPENPNALDCGFAWVCLPGNASFARRCSTKAKKGGDAARYGSKMSGLGWTFWKPGGFRGQAIGHHEAGAKAFRAVLAKHGIRADFGSRYD
jgi:hypothetical protein